MAIFGDSSMIFGDHGLTQINLENVCVCKRVLLGCLLHGVMLWLNQLNKMQQHLFLIVLDLDISIVQLA